jgi:hypothetical protein
MEFAFCSDAGKAFCFVVDNRDANGMNERGE